MTINQIKTVRIKNINLLCEDVKKFTFNINSVYDLSLDPKPGQFLMIWVPGIDEIPMSISSCDQKGNWNFIVKKVGECTEELFKLKAGDFIGIRGPFGNSFTLPPSKDKKIFLVGGGTGIAPLKFLAIKLREKNLKFQIIQGARTETEMIFKNASDIYAENFSDINFCTDDGSLGSKLLASDEFKNQISKISKNLLTQTKVYTCGPEHMVYEVYKTCLDNQIEMEASLERMMRCGCGLCGLCALDPTGQLVCKDGPVFTAKQLEKIDDFGRFKRNLAGKKIPL